MIYKIPCFSAIKPRLKVFTESEAVDQQPEQEPESDTECSYFGRSLSRSRSGNFCKKPDQEPELCYGSFSFKLSVAYDRKIEQYSI